MTRTPTPSFADIGFTSYTSAGRLAERLSKTPPCWVLHRLPRRLPPPLLRCSPGFKDGVTNMQAGYFGMMSQPVLAAYHRNIDRANRDSSFFARREFPALSQQVRARVAEFIGAKPREIAFTRNATEALQAMISQYNKVGRDDTLMYADLDYNAMQYAMNALAKRTGATLVTFDIPEPASYENIMAAYTKALDANPKTKLLLLTHCNNKTGLLLPVKDIIAIAKPRGIDVVLDAAHSFGQVPLTMAQLDADFVGLNLHKWIGAPVGAGVMYIREDKLASIDVAHGDPGSLQRIDSRIHTGTSNFATIMTIPDALDFQATIGMENKAARRIGISIEVWEVCRVPACASRASGPRRRRDLRAPTGRGAVWFGASAVPSAPDRHRMGRGGAEAGLPRTPRAPDASAGGSVGRSGGVHGVGR